MNGPTDEKIAWINSQVRRFADRAPPDRVVIFDDTTNFMSIERDHFIDLGGKLFFVRCNEREGRFGLEDQPKFWVKRALALDTGQMHVLKLVFYEEFKVRVGNIQVKCVRNGEKEGRVLELVRGDPRFMQGHTSRDSGGNLVRVIDFIPGVDLLGYVREMELSHLQYFQNLFPDILAHVIECFRGIARLHEAGLCHGDIRNDHILVERETGRFRWIDFDLDQNFPDLDVWSLGNILHCMVGKGFVTFRGTLTEHPELVGCLVDEDASALHAHRVMNLRKIFPYIPEVLNDMLLRFSAGTRVYYDSVDQILCDLENCTAVMGWPAELRDKDDSSIGD